MKRLIALLLAFSLLSCPVFADAEEVTDCEHFRAWAEWNEEISVEVLDAEAHRYTAICPDCGASVVRDEEHSFSFAPEAEAYDAKQHRTLKTCAACGFAVYVYADHEWQYGDWQTDETGLRYRIGSCAICGAENPSLDFYETEPVEDNRDEMAEESGIPLPEDNVLPTEMPFPDFTIPEIAEAENTQAASYPIQIISVTVPDNLPLTATGDGYVYAIDNLSIVNHSDEAVIVTGITVESAGEWALMPYTGSNAVTPSNVKSIGISINGAITTVWGQTESLYLPGDWTIERGASLPLRYDASVSFAELPHEGEQVLFLTFVLDWA